MSVNNVKAMDQVGKGNRPGWILMGCGWVLMGCIGFWGQTSSY